MSPAMEANPPAADTKRIPAPPPALVSEIPPVQTPAGATAVLAVATRKATVVAGEVAEYSGGWDARTLVFTTPAADTATTHRDQPTSDQLVVRRLRRRPRESSLACATSLVAAEESVAPPVGGNSLVFELASCSALVGPESSVAAACRAKKPGRKFETAISVPAGSAYPPPIMMPCPSAVSVGTPSVSHCGPGGVVTAVELDTDSSVPRMPW